MTIIPARVRSCRVSIFAYVRSYEDRVMADCVSQAQHKESNGSSHEVIIVIKWVIVDIVLKAR